MSNKRGIDLASPGEAAPFAYFKCGATQVSVLGSVILPVSQNLMKLS